MVTPIETKLKRMRLLAQSESSDCTVGLAALASRPLEANLDNEHHDTNNEARCDCLSSTNGLRSGFDQSTAASCVDSSVVYHGVPLRPDGMRLPINAQEQLFKVLKTIYDGYGHEQLDIELSFADKELFEDAWMERYPAEARHQWKIASTYGELTPVGLLDMLWKLGAKPGHRFYDLGSGPGKLVVLAWMVGLRATGVELSRKRWEGYVRAVDNLKQLDGALEFPTDAHFPNRMGMECICADMLEVDFTDADVLFVNSVLLQRVQLIDLGSVVRCMKPGSVVVSYDGFDGLEFRKLGVISLPTSFGPADYVVQEVIGKSATRDKLPQGIKRPEKFSQGDRRYFCS